MVLETFFTVSSQLIAQFSYLGIFLISIASTSTIFFPLPLYAVIFLAAGLGLNPFLVGVVAGVGSAFGELTGYLVGAGGKQLFGKKIRNFPKKHRTLEKFKELFLRFGFPIIIVTAFLPFPFDFIGILSGTTNYNVKKFLTATIIGKIAKTLLIAYAGALALPYIGIFFRPE